MIQNFCKKYKLPERLLFDLLSHTTEVHYPKGTLVIKEGERNANLYLLRQEKKTFHTNTFIFLSI